MLQRTPIHTRTGQPEGWPWWRPPLILAALVGASLLGWVLIAGVVWAMWLGRAYVIVAVCVTLALAVVAYAAHLAVKRDRRSKVLAVVIVAALTALILWVLPR